MPLAPGYDPQEALQMLGLCAYVETGAPEPPIPDPTGTWQLTFDSPVMGWFDNKWQLWTNKQSGDLAIAIRGTVAKAGSIIEDLVALMIAGKGMLTVGPQTGGLTINYQFAADPEAGVHLGFALGLFALLNDPANGILAKIGTIANSNVYITGHSQGAAIATLLRSYLHYEGKLPGCSVKTYVFAQPRPGNAHYAEDFEELFSKPGMAFRVTNTLDWVTEVPFTVQLISDIDKPNPISVLTLGFFLNALKIGLDAIYETIAHHTRTHFQPAAASLMRAGTSTEPRGLFAPPALDFAADYCSSLNYVNAGADIALTGVPADSQQATDFLFEHHATTYYRLMTAVAAAAQPGS